MGKRRLELEPEEIASDFKRDKLDVENHKSFVNLFVQLKVLVEINEHKISKGSKSSASDGKIHNFKHISLGDIHRVISCIEALTEICLKLILDGDVKPMAKKPDDLKNSLEKYKDWANAIVNDIIDYFCTLLHHSKSAVCKGVLHHLMKIVCHQALVHGVFPQSILKQITIRLLDEDCLHRDLIQSISKELSHEDLAYQMFIILDELVTDSSTDCDKSAEYAKNLVTILMILRVPPKKHGIIHSALWCSHRNLKSKKKIESNDDMVPDNKKNKKKHKKGKLNKDGKMFDHRKSRYSEVIDETLYNGREPDLGENDENDVDEDFNEDQMNDLKEFLSGVEIKKPEDVEGDMEIDQELDSEEEERKRDDFEFKRGQKIKKPRTDKRNIEGSNDVPPPEMEEEDEFAEAVKRGPKIKPVKENDRLLPKEAFSHNNFGYQEDETEEEESEDETESSDIDRDVHKGPVYKICYPQACDHLTNIWDSLTKMNLTDELYKKCLVFIPEHVLDHLHDPLNFTDFFMESYNCGGVVSLMAMRGVFLLITKYNLHYPEFYPKLYSLIDPTVCHIKYKPRFFLLLNVFLSSTHLPEYIAGSFVKVLSRLLHFAPQHSTLLVLKIMNNILARFPSLSVMYDNNMEVKEDPFIVVAKDLKMNKATDSSLWEVASIRKCSHEKIHKGGQFIQRVCTPEEIAIKPGLLELDYEDLDESTSESASKIGSAATNYKLQGDLFSTNEPFSYFFNI